MSTKLAEVLRSINATDDEHAQAIATFACAICGAAAGDECTYGTSLTFGRTAADGPKVFPGRAHLRRVRMYLGSLDLPP